MSNVNQIFNSVITSNIAAFKSLLEKELSSRILEKIEERKVEIASELVGVRESTDPKKGSTEYYKKKALDRAYASDLTKKANTKFRKKTKIKESNSYVRTPHQDKIYREGHSHGLSGKSHSDNPYKNNPNLKHKANEWHRGWNDGNEIYTDNK